MSRSNSNPSLDRLDADPFHCIESPQSSAGAIAMIRIVHPEPERIGLPNPKLGEIRYGRFFDLDDGVIVRWDDDSIMLMPHGGLAIVREISKELNELSVPIQQSDDPIRVYPEAESEIEAMMLDALARATSPLGVDVLLAQPKRWARLGITTRFEADGLQAGLIDDLEAGMLGRLLEPPMVVAVGRSNIGKSTLINALVGQQVALVADVVGTTRDHVGVLVDLGGLVVRWIDTPGIDERVGENSFDHEAINIAIAMLKHADMVIHCIDSSDDAGMLDPRLSRAIKDGTRMIRVGMRSDLAPHTLPIDCRVSISKGGLTEGLEQLVEHLRNALIEPKVLDDPRPWRFWGTNQFPLGS